MPPAKNDDAQTARYEEILASLQAKGVLAASKVSGKRVTGKKPEKRPAAADPSDHEKPAADGAATPSTTAGENSADASSSSAAPPAKKKAKAKATPKPKTKAKATAKPATAKPAAPAKEDGDANHEPRVAYSDKFWDDELKMTISWKVFPEVVKRCSKIYVADAPAIRDALIPKLGPPPEDLLEKLKQAEAAAKAESEAAAAAEAATPGPAAKSTKAEAKPKAKGKAKATPKAKQPAKPPSPEPEDDDEGDDEGDEEGEEEQMEDDAETVIAPPAKKDTEVAQQKQKANNHALEKLQVSQLRNNCDMS